MDRFAFLIVGSVVVTLLASAALADASLASTAFSTAGRVEFSQGGQLTVGNDIFGIAAPNYSRQIENTDVGMNVELYAMGQRTSWKGRYITIEKFLDPQGDGSFTVTWALDLKPCGQPAIANLCIEVPSESFDELPPQPVRRPDADGVFRLNGLFGGMELSVAGSDGQWFFEDFRKAAWSGRFRFRCTVPYTGLQPWKGRLSMNFKGTAVRHPAFRVLDLSSAANTGLTDETDGDRKGGWTDQGRNDLSPLAKGASLTSRFVPLSVSPRAIVLAGGDRTYFPAESGEIPVGFKVRRLDFLHAVAWAGNPGSVAFRYRVRYADGSTAVIPVITGEDVNNWHGVVEPSRGYVAWEGANSASSLSLHHSRWVNPSPEKAVAGVTALGNPNGGAVPMVLGVTALDADKLTDRQFRTLENLFLNKPRNDVDTSTWYPCGLSWGGPGKTIAAGSALDASVALATAASAFDRHVCGELGRLVAVGDHLEFEKHPGKPVALWGVNFASNSSSPPKDLAQGIVDNLKRQGVNLLRFHKFAGFPGRQMTPDGLFLPERQDRMDYFISLLKKAGIYVYLDWEDVLAFPDVAGPWPFKKGLQFAPVFVSAIRERERTYARALFGHRNPYTGLSYAEDPAVAFIEILNEVDLCTIVNGNPRQALDPEFYAELDRLWKLWNGRHGKTDVKSIADEVGNPDRLKFATSVQRAYQKSQRTFLREELGFRGLVTGNNIVQHAYAVTAINDGMDFAGLHGYVGHIPGYYNTPYDNTSVVKTVSPGIPFFGQTWERPANLPYCFGEWNFCYPNDYRSEGLPFTTAMMAFQGWPISLFYAFTGPMNWGEWEHFHAKGIEGIFAHGAGMDPSTWGLTVPCAIAFRRGDIRPSKNVITVRHTRDELLNMSNPFLMRQMALSWMFMLGRVYTEVADEPDLTHWPMKRESGLGEWDEIKSVARGFGIDGVKDGYLVSDTGEMKKFIGDGLFLVDTPRSKFAIGNLSSMRRDGRVLSGVAVKSPETFAALTLTSLDTEPTSVETAKRVLICLVGNSRNGAAVIRGRTIVDPGWDKSRTVLAEPLEVTLTLPIVDGSFKVYKLSTRTGERQGEIPVNADGSFTIPKSAHTIYFEVVRQPSVRVAVIGGSITAGAGASSVEKRWPNRFVSFLQEKFPETRFELVNAGIGATGSEIGACRVKRDVLEKNPDLVIVEFSVNDTSTRESAESYEGLIRQLLAADRKPDVMCLGMVDQRGVSAQAWHEQVARHYGLPFVSYRDEVWPKIQKGELRWTDVAADSVHPNDMGHDLAARLLFRTYDKSSKVRETLPPPLFGTTLAHGDFVKMTDLEPLENNGFFPLKDSMWGIGLACTNANGRLLVRAKGRAVAILYRKGCAPYNWGKIAVSLDGGEPRVIDCFSDQWWWYTPDVFLCRDTPGEHLIEIRTLPEKNPKSRGYGCHLTGILVCEAEGLH